MSIRECPKCFTHWDGDICPVCEVPLLSEVSSEDGDDGIFSEPEPEVDTMLDIIDDLASECYTLRQDNIELISQINRRKP